MNIVFYIAIFLIGTIIGSLLGKIINRTIKGKYTFSLQSYCSKCGQKLKIIDQIPILSYILLRGKCRNCSKPINKKYIILEIITGLLFISSAYVSGIDIANINTNNLISFLFIVLYFTYIILAVMLDLETRKMPSTILTYGVSISVLYILNLILFQNANIFTMSIYLLSIIFLLAINILNTKKRAQSSYVLDSLTMLLTMLIFTEHIVCILTIIGTLISIVLYILINKLKQAKNKIKKEVFYPNVKIVFIMGTLNIIYFLSILSI